MGATALIPTFRIGFLFHADLALLERTLPRCLEALTSGTAETYEVVVWCDGTPPEAARQLPERAAAWGIDELVLRRRERFVASGDASNNGHHRFFPTSSPYLIVIEDDVVMYRTEPSFDVLAACRALFERHPQVPVLCKVDDVNGHLKLRVGGQVISGLADTVSPDGRPPELRVGGQLNGTTPLPASASASRWLSPLVSTRCAWCSSRSTVAVARVLGMIVSNPDG